MILEWQSWGNGKGGGHEYFASIGQIYHGQYRISGDGGATVITVTVRYTGFIVNPGTLMNR